MASRELFFVENHPLFDHYNMVINIANLKPCRTFFFNLEIFTARPIMVDKVSLSKWQEKHTWSLVTILSWHQQPCIDYHWWQWHSPFEEGGGECSGVGRSQGWIPHLFFLLLLPLLIPSIQAADSIALETWAINSASVIYKLCDLGQVALPLWASTYSSEVENFLRPCV